MQYPIHYKTKKKEFNIPPFLKTFKPDILNAPQEMLV